MTRIHNQLDKIFVGFDHLLNSPLVTAQSLQVEYPRYNIEKTEQGYQIQVAVPGWRKEQIKVSLVNCLLTVTGEKREETETREWLHKGISGKSFEKSLKLDDALEVSSASMENGMLYISLVWREDDTSKFIDIT